MRPAVQFLAMGLINSLPPPSQRINNLRVGVRQGPQISANSRRALRYATSCCRASKLSRECERAVRGAMVVTGVGPVTNVPGSVSCFAQPCRPSRARKGTVEASCYTGCRVSTTGVSHHANARCFSSRQPKYARNLDRGLAPAALSDPGGDRKGVAERQRAPECRLSRNVGPDLATPAGDPRRNPVATYPACSRVASTRRRRGALHRLRNESRRRPGIRTGRHSLRRRLRGPPE